MKNQPLKISAILFCVSLFAVSCKTVVNDDANLPKDISERPADENSQKYDQARLDKIKSAIEEEIAKEECKEAADWTFSPIGSKACGGPISYIAYPKKIENSVLPKIQSYTNVMSEYNKKYNITSDCMMAAEPTSVKCENGKAVLVY
ncbi:hypothetical protein PFY12_06220 [Chryseobacterium camelliae]|uniref:Lipoprotein n=1 Tax=Chryseobacterium camelliae TaxID=1265445 RepID=A0ABY7QPZ8_9FLAO|nr:hypothetical protein [Chryseobacterium camelliae]WBV61715.1 hypothetical protein PFY12_06220 [Chryseobacterium camelliae]